MSNARSETCQVKNFFLETKVGFGQKFFSENKDGFEVGVFFQKQR